MPVVVFYEKETETKAKITMVHNQPYHEKHGLSQERINEGIELDKMPKQEQIEGKRAISYINPQTGEVWYEYKDKNLTDKERIKQLEDRIAELESK